MSRTLVHAQDIVLAALAVALALPLWLLPWRAACLLGRLYGRLICLVPYARRTAMINLRRAYGKSMTVSKARRWNRQVCASLGQGLAEGIQFSRRFKGSGWQQVCEVENPALHQALMCDRRPKIFVTGHLGSWEVAMILLGIWFPGAAVIRRLDNPFLNKIVRRMRLRNAEQWIEKKGALRECLRRLRRGESVAMLLDENAGGSGPFVEFFGRPASTRRTAALLSVRTGARIVVAGAIRRPGHHNLLFRFQPIDPAEGSDVVKITQQIASAYEGWVRQYPLQWRWAHWRWRNRPDGGMETYSAADLAACFSDGSVSTTSAVTTNNIDPLPRAAVGKLGPIFDRLHPRTQRGKPQPISGVTFMGIHHRDTEDTEGHGGIDA